MSRLTKGMVVRTSYGTGPYRIVEAHYGCTCPSFTDAINLFDEAPPSKPHYHLLCQKVGEETGFYHLNGYDENLNSVWNGVDHLIVCAEETLLLMLGL